MPASEETGSGPVIHDHRRIDPVTGQVRGKHAASSRPAPLVPAAGRDRRRGEARHSRDRGFRTRGFRDRGFRDRGFRDRGFRTGAGASGSRGFRTGAGGGERLRDRPGGKCRRGGPGGKD